MTRVPGRVGTGKTEADREDMTGDRVEDPVCRHTIIVETERVGILVPGS